MGTLRGSSLVVLLLLCTHESFAATSARDLSGTRLKRQPPPVSGYDDSPFAPRPLHFDLHSCGSRCDAQFNRNLPCQCNQRCLRFNDCCTDYAIKCSQNAPNADIVGNGANVYLQNLTFSHSDENDLHSSSCDNRCGAKFNRDLPCQCNTRCVKFNNCCNDYERMCLTCEGKCEDDYDSDLPCQCNQACSKHNDCCNDYSGTCNADESQSVTDAELQTLSEALLANDVNNVANLVTVNQQGSTSFHSTKDNAPLPLLTVEQSAYSKPTIVKLLPLYNNYVATVGDPEVVTSQETQEETAFLDAILPTTVMKKAEKFLIDKGYVQTRRRLSNGSYRTNSNAFREAIHQIWFGLYSRENRTLGSSGFEHVFLGEIKQGKVQGFHNWVFFSKEEQNNNLNYKGKIGPNVSLGNKGMIVKHKFDWIRKEKPISSMFVGTSPEFEIALYSVCFFTRPGAKCPVKLNGKNVNIQTHYSYRQGKRYVGSAFPDI